MACGYHADWVSHASSHVGVRAPELRLQRLVRDFRIRPLSRDQDLEMSGHAFTYHAEASESTSRRGQRVGNTSLMHACKQWVYQSARCM